MEKQRLCKRTYRRIETPRRTELPGAMIQQVEVLSLVESPSPRIADGEFVTLATMRDGTVLEFECGDRIRVFWSRKEFDEGRPPHRVLWIYDERGRRDIARQEALEALARYEALTMPEEFAKIMSHHIIRKGFETLQASEVNR